MKLNIGMVDSSAYARMMHLIRTSGRAFICLSLERCSPCVQVKRVFQSCLPESAAHDSMIVEFDRYNAADRQIIRELNIRAFPQIRFYRAGKLVSAVEGGFAGDDFTAINELRDWLSPLLETKIVETFA